MGADVNVKDENRATPLHVAAYNGHPEVIEVLLKHGARKDLTDDSNRTPLQDAELNKNINEHFDRITALLK